jgi:putative membrane protein
MYEFLTASYLWLLAFHLVSVMSWMAGLLYLPRLYVYHSQVEVGTDQDRLFQTMEKKLLRVIMNPAMIATWIFGILLVISADLLSEGFSWFYLKLAFVFLLTFFHMKLAVWRGKFASGANEKSENFYRKINEVPTVLMIAIVFIAILKPF